jgi:hypothetical protein
MNLQYRIDLMVRLGEYILSEDPEWIKAKEEASIENGWFIPEFVDQAVKAIANSFLNRGILEKWTKSHNIPETQANPKKVGITMAGNIPLVGFYDLLAVFISGHNALLKPSSKDKVLIQHLVNKLTEWDEEAGQRVQFSDMLKGCDAYIATGSNNSSRYFDYYFGKYPHIIRRNRTSIAILTGDESTADLEKLADDVFMYFGMGCRNVTKIYVPENYDFIPLLTAFRKYIHLADHHKYKNNYDYNLAILILNNKYYMSTEAIILVENEELFSPISQLNYSYYSDKKTLESSLAANSELQCVIGQGFIPFGQSQCPGIEDHADGIDTLAFAANL